MAPAAAPEHPCLDRLESTRLVVVEWHSLLRDALACLLRSAEFATTTDAGTSEHLDVTLCQHQPDVVVVGIDPDVPASLALVGQIPAIARQWPTLVVTVPQHPTIHARAIELGAMGIVTRDQPGDILIKAVRKILAGELWLDRTRAAGVVARLRGSVAGEDHDLDRIDALTRREREIVDLITEGLTNKLIAGRLCISEATVRNHLTSVLDKLDLADRFQLAVFAFRRGLVPYPHPAALLLQGTGSYLPWKRMVPSPRARPKRAVAG
jgi:DNA-binding NarL/FixJ family response regulator